MALIGDCIMKTKILLVGPVLTRSGYGEQARFALRSLRTREDIYDIYVHPLQWGQTSWVAEYDEEKTYIDSLIEKTIIYGQQGGQFDVSLQVTIPNEWKKHAPVNVGYTAGIETTRVAHEWLTTANQMDKVIVVSQHSKDVFKSTNYTGLDEQNNEVSNLAIETPIDVVNYPAKKYDELEQLSLNIETDFNFLSVAQFGPRKNMINMVRWFVEEFRDNPDVGFVIKTNKAKNCLMDREVCEGEFKAFLSDYPDRKCKVYLIHGDMSDREMHSLYTNEKISAFVGIPHGEGFGLPLFEAAYSGLPVVATGWSGQMDFLCDSAGQEHFYNVAYDISEVPEEVVWPGVLIKESAWAYAREGSYKQKLQECYADIKNDKGIATAAPGYAEVLQEVFDEQKMYKQFVDSVSSIEGNNEWVQTLSQIEMI
jgi:glycosyltransferase involved in cell wall biosynthesis